MELVQLRDLVLVIYGFLGIGATLFIVVLLVITYRKVGRLLDLTRETVTNVRDYVRLKNSEV